MGQVLFHDSLMSVGTSLSAKYAKIMELFYRDHCWIYALHTDAVNAVCDGDSLFCDGHTRTG